MPGKYNKVQLRKGLAKHAPADNAPSDSANQPASQVGTGKEEEQFLLDLPTSPQPPPESPPRPS